VAITADSGKTSAPSFGTLKVRPRLLRPEPQAEQKRVLYDGKRLRQGPIQSKVT